MRRYLTLINFYGSMDQSMADLGATLAASLGKGVPREVETAIIQATGESLRENYPRMLAETEVAMAGVLSIQELEAAVGFYESPMGRSITLKMGRLTPIVAAQTQRWAPIFQADIERRICARLTCSQTAQQAPPGG